MEQQGELCVVLVGGKKGEEGKKDSNNGSEKTGNHHNSLEIVAKIQS